MPSAHYSVRVPLQEAEILGDLYGIDADLNHVIRSCDAVSRLVGERNWEPEILESLVCAAVVRYFRCFSGSPRLGLRDEEIGVHNKELREVHQWFRALRDKFVAHCINPLEQVYVTAALAVKDGEHQPLSALSHASVRLALGDREAVALRELAVHARRLVARKVGREYSLVLRAVQELPLEEVRSWASLPYAKIRGSDVFKTRRQTRAKLT